MVQIDEALLRGRAEHNDRSLVNLKEISLHQQNIEGINRLLSRLCPELEILYLQVRCFQLRLHRTRRPNPRRVDSVPALHDLRSHAREHREFSSK